MRCTSGTRVFSPYQRRDVATRVRSSAMLYQLRYSSGISDKLSQDLMARIYTGFGYTKTMTLKVNVFNVIVLMHWTISLENSRAYFDAIVDSVFFYKLNLISLVE